MVQHQSGRQRPTMEGASWMAHALVYRIELRLCILVEGGLDGAAARRLPNAHLCCIISGASSIAEGNLVSEALNSSISLGKKMLFACNFEKASLDISTSKGFSARVDLKEDQRKEEK
eukprot:1160947-Pelagomonas_calceolata.AAC.7